MRAFLPGTNIPADPAETEFALPDWFVSPTTVAPRGGLRRQFLDAFGDKSQKTNITSISDAYNSTWSQVNNTSDSGNTSVSIGSGSGSGGAADLVPGVIALFAILGGLYLITR